MAARKGDRWWSLPGGLGHPLPTQSSLAPGHMDELSVHFLRPISPSDCEQLEGKDILKLLP